MDDKTQLASDQKAGRWSKEEKALFKEALHAYGRDWKQVCQHVGSRTPVQVRSHAQKYFKKQEKKLSKKKAELRMPQQDPSLECLHQQWMFHCSKAIEYFCVLSQLSWPHCG